MKEDYEYPSEDLIHEWRTSLKTYYGEDKFYKIVANKAEIIRDSFTHNKELMREVIYDIVTEDCEDSGDWLMEIALYECALELID